MSEIDLTYHHERGADDPTGEVLPLDGEPEDEQAAPSKPVSLPAPRSTEEQRVARSLRGHVASPAWLPAWPELAERKAEHTRLVDAIARAMAELSELEATWRREDQAYQERLRLSVRGGERVPEDTRTPPETRDQQRGTLVDQMWAAAGVLAELVTEILESLRSGEGDILARLRGEHVEAESKVRELQQLLQEARVREWWIHQQANWLMQSVEDGPLSRQPAPVPSPPPPTFDRALLERPWYRPQPTAA